MKFLKKLSTQIKSKPGGTATGNLLRAFASQKSGGVFGSGAMMAQDGETKDEKKQRLLKALGAAAATFNSKASQPNPNGAAAAFETGARGQVIKGILGKVVIGLVMVIGLVKGIPFLISKLKKSNNGATKKP